MRKPATPSSLSKDPILHDQKENEINRLEYLIKTLAKAIFRVPRSEHNEARVTMMESIRQKIGKLKGD